MFRLWLVIALLISPVASYSAVRTWTGAGPDQNWQTATNWQDNQAPVANDDLIFPATALQQTNNNNFFFLTSFRSIKFEGGTYSIGGNPIRLSNGIVVDGGTQTLSMAVTLLAAQTVTSAQGGTLTMLILSIGSNPVLINGNGTVGIGLISGSGRVTKEGLGIAGIFAASGFSGPIDHNDGIFVVDASIGTSTVTINSQPISGTLGLAGFGGTGTIGATTLTSGVISSGTLTSLTGILNINGGITMQSAGTYLCKIAGTAPGADGHDQLNVTGTVTLNNAALVPLPLGTFRPAIRDRYMVLKNDGNDAVNGTFLNLPEGSSFAGAGNTAFRITYVGGDGNDIEISVIPKAPFDFDGDNRTDIGVYRPADGNWYLSRSTAGNLVASFGNSSDLIVPADYDGDGRTDIAVYRPSEGQWFRISSLTSTVSVNSFGIPGDRPAPGDFDGDGRADLAVFRPSEGTWWLDQTTAGVSVVSFGMSGDVPSVGDYDGDGISDIAIYRASTGTWWINKSQSGITAQGWGNSTDLAVPADYDGDGRTDVAVYRPSQGQWFLYESSTQSPRVLSFGISGDIPVAGDYDGDGKCDVAIFRPSTGAWWLNGSTSGVTVISYGISGDKPIASAFVNSSE